MSEEEVFEEICNGAGVKNRASLRRAFADKQVRKYLSVGHYTISPENSSVYVARMLNNAWQTPVKLTLSGSLRIKTNIAAKVSSQLLLDSAAVYKALCDDELLSRWGFNSRNVFSLLMPATYEMYWTASVEDFFDKMKAVYDGFWGFQPFTDGE